MKCPSCGKEITTKTEKIQRVIYILIILLIIFSAWAYKHDLAACYELVKSCPYQTLPIQTFVP